MYDYLQCRPQRATVVCVYFRRVLGIVYLLIYSVLDVFQNVVQFKIAY
jgi:hypothetical protein